MPVMPPNDAHHDGFFMGKQKYTKQVLTVEQQLTSLAKQGLQINDWDLAYHVLNAVSYYCLFGYLLHFKPHSTH